MRCRGVVGVLDDGGVEMYNGWSSGILYQEMLYIHKSHSHMHLSNRLRYMQGIMQATGMTTHSLTYASSVSSPRIITPSNRQALAFEPCGHHDAKKIS